MRSTHFPCIIDNNAQPSRARTLNHEIKFEDRKWSKQSLPIIPKSLILHKGTRSWDEDTNRLLRLSMRSSQTSGYRTCVNDFMRIFLGLWYWAKRTFFYQAGIRAPKLAVTSLVGLSSKSEIGTESQSPCQQNTLLESRTTTHAWGDIHFMCWRSESLLNISATGSQPWLVSPNPYNNNISYIQTKD